MVAPQPPRSHHRKATLPTLSIAGAIAAARVGGFSGEPLVTAVAIAMAESSLVLNARHVNTDGSIDRGLWQINSRWHQEVSDACADDPACAAKAVYVISGKGTNFTPWSTFTGGQYQAHVAAVRAALGPAPPATAVTKPAMTFIGTAGQNIFKGQGLPKRAIVCHIMEGTLAGCDSWFSDPAAQASANYGISKDGTIHCYVDPEGLDAPWANGIINGPDASVQKLLAAYPVNPNLISVSLEHEGHHGDVLAGAQLDASAHLAAWLCQRFGIPNDEDHLLGHFEYDSVTRANCPGWDRAGWLRYEAAINAQLGGVTPAPGPVRPDVPDAQTRIASAMTDLEAAQEDLNSPVTKGDVMTTDQAQQEPIEQEAGAPGDTPLPKPRPNLGDVAAWIQNGGLKSPEGRQFLAALEMLRVRSPGPDYRPFSGGRVRDDFPPTPAPPVRAAAPIWIPIVLALLTAANQTAIALQALPPSATTVTIVLAIVTGIAAGLLQLQSIAAQTQAHRERLALILRG